MIACQVLVQIYSTKEFGCHTVCVGLCCVHTDVYRMPSFLFFFFSIFFRLFVCMGTLVCLLTHDITSFFHCSFASAQHFCCWHIFFLVFALHCSALAEVASSLRSFFIPVFGLQQFFCLWYINDQIHLQCAVNGCLYLVITINIDVYVCLSLFPNHLSAWPTANPMRNCTLYTQ